METEKKMAITTDTSSNLEIDWPKGKYLYVDSVGYYYEEWAKGDSGVFNGAGYFLTKNGVDTLFSMTMKLKRLKENTFMYYNVKGQNENKDIEFKLTKEEGNFFVFENPRHDFPSIMEYKILGDSAIEVKETGFVKNKELVRDFVVKKID